MKIFLLSSLFMLMACSFPEDRPFVTNPDYDALLTKLLDFTAPLIGVSGLDSLMQGEEIILLDTRARNEYDVSHIRNARFVPYKGFSEELVKDIPLDKTIVVYCSVGYRSSKVAKKMMEKGYSKVFNLYGGIFEWANQEQPLVDSDESSTNRIHGYDSNWGKWVENKGMETVW
jgi:rhodanese-related sulfurtransferase